VLQPYDNQPNIVFLSNLKVHFFRNIFFNILCAIYMFAAQHIEKNFFYWVQDSSYITWITSECSTEDIIIVKVCNNIIRQP